MPMPWSYRHATKDFQAFLAEAQERLGTPTDNMTYTAVDAVFQVFRKRLTIEQALRFADLLPAVLRAMFVDHWDTTSEPLPFADRQTLAQEVKSVRPHHNLTPGHAIEAVAAALRCHVNQVDLDRVLQRFPAGAADYWQTDIDPKELTRRIV